MQAHSPRSSLKIAPRNLPAYHHEQLGVCFAEMDRLIRIMLDTVVPSNFIALPLKFVRDTIYATSIEKDSYFQGSRFYLAVSADIREADLIDRARKLIKTVSASEIELLIRNALPGMKLTHVPTPPRAIPVKLKHQYFAIEQEGPFWETVLRSRTFAAYVPSEILNPQMELVILAAGSEFLKVGRGFIPGTPRLYRQFCGYLSPVLPPCFRAPSLRLVSGARVGLRKIPISETYMPIRPNA